MKIGPFEVDSPFILAPMAGITHSPFRRFMRKKGSAIVISELVSANGLHYSSARTKSLLAFHEEERPVGLQIFGEDRDRLASAAQVIEKLGADFVDLNLGCPVPKIVKKGAGSALCRDPANLFKILDAMVRSVKIPVTIKIRTGWDAQSINVHEIIRVATDAGISFVAIHGRTRAQGYSGLADWDLIREAKAKSKIPILGNGDCITPQIALDRYRTSGVDGVLIGRGALRNPFIFKQCQDLLRGDPPRETKPNDYLAIIQELKNYLEESFNVYQASIQSRKFLSWFSAGFPESSEFRRKVFLPDSDVWSLALEYFGGIQERSEVYLSQPFLMGGHG